jgi:hypothetical protein
MIVSLARAVRCCGARNAGTALEMVSIPVIAVDPEANARSASSTPTVCVACCGAGGAGDPIACQSPVATSTAIARMNAYVGAANSVPAWRTPRRFAPTSTAITPAPSGTTAPPSAGTADVTAASPDATDTATVST